MKISFIKETGIYFIPVLTQLVIIPLSLFVYTKVLTPSDYGILAIITATAALASAFSNWGLINGMVRFLGEPKDDVNRLIGTAYYGSLGTGALVFLVFYAFSSFFARTFLNSADYRTLFIIGVSTVIFWMAFQSFQDLMRMEKRPVIYVIFEVAKSVGSFGLGAYLVYFLKLGILGVVSAALIVQLILVIIQYIYFVPEYKLSFSWGYFKKMARYGAPFTIIIISAWMLDSADRYILKFFVRMGDLGLYNVAYSYGILIQSFVSPFVLAVLPYLFDVYREGEYGKKTGRLALFYLIAYTGIALVASFLTKPYFLILTPPQFHAAAHIAPLITLSYAWRGLFNLFCFCNTLTGNAKAQFFIEISAALINIVLNFIFIPLWGIYGAAYATVAAWIWMLALAYRYNQKILPIELPKKEVSQVLGIGMLCFSFIFFLNFSSIWPLGALAIFLYILFIHRRIYPLTQFIKLLPIRL